MTAYSAEAIRVLRHSRCNLHVEFRIRFKEDVAEGSMLAKELDRFASATNDIVRSTMDAAIAASYATIGLPAPGNILTEDESLTV